MQSSGSGLTFTDQDVKHCRVIMGLLSRATYKDLDAAAVVEGGNAFKWIEELCVKIKDNVLDYSTAKMVEPAPAPATPIKAKGRGKK